MAGARKKKKRRRGTPLGRALRTFYAAAVLLSAVIVTTYALFQILVPAPTVEQPPAPTAGQSENPTDNPDTPDIDESTAPPSQQALERKDQFYTFLLAASDQVSGNSDTIMVASYDVPNQKVALVSIPRDTLVNGKYGSHRYYKINSAYSYGGIEELRNVVADMLGIPIDFYVTVDLNAFVEIVDAVGGVDFYVPVDMNYDADDQNLHIHYDKGMHYGLTGQQVLEIARCRKNSDGPGTYPDNVYDVYAGSGTNREQTQRELMVAIARKLISWNSIPKITEFAGIVGENVKTNMSASDLVFFATRAIYVDMDGNVTTTIFPGNGEVSYKGWNWCWQYYPEESLEIINTYLNPYTTDITMDMTNMFQVQ